VDPEPPHVLKGELTDEQFEAKVRHAPSNRFVARRLADLMRDAELDVDADGTVEAHEGVRNYLPGYQASGDPFVQSPVLSTGSSHMTAIYRGQQMRIILPGLGREAGVETIRFRIRNCTSWSGYCVNASFRSTRGGPGDSDYSLNRAQDKLALVITRDSPAPGEDAAEGGQIEEGRSWVLLWCKDYGGSCLVEIQPEKAGRALPKLSLRIPYEANPNGIADLWEERMLEAWQDQFGQQRAGGRFDPLEDGELRDPDGAGPRPEHEVAGDGLRVRDEYRGFILDPRTEQPQQHPDEHHGGHLRLSAARKELLVQVNEMGNIDDPKRNRANAAAEKYTRTKTMSGIAEFFSHPERGAEIDLYWCYLPAELGPAVIYADGTSRERAYYYEGPMTRRVLDGPNEQLAGGAFIESDSKLRSKDEQEANRLFGNYACLRAQRDADMEEFVKLLLVSRWGSMAHDGTVQVPAEGPAITRMHPGHPVLTQGSIVGVNGVSEEGPHKAVVGRHYTEPEFQNVLQWAVAHELGHLIIRVEAGEGWVGGGHVAGVGFLMGPFPGVQGINAVQVGAVEMSGIGLPNRASVRRRPAR